MCQEEDVCPACLVPEPIPRVIRDGLPRVSQWLHMSGIPHAYPRQTLGCKAQPQWTGSSHGSWAREQPDTTIQGNDAICRMRPLSCWWTLGQGNVLERPGPVLRYFCAEQLFRSGGGLTPRQEAWGRSAREPALLNTY